MSKPHAKIAKYANTVDLPSDQRPTVGADKSRVRPVVLVGESGQHLTTELSELLRRRLRILQQCNRFARHRVLPCGGPDRTAFHRVDVELVDDQNVIEGGSQVREKPNAGCDEFGLREAGARVQQPMICPCVVVRHCSIGEGCVRHGWRGVVATPSLQWGITILL